MASHGKSPRLAALSAALLACACACGGGGGGGGYHGIPVFHESEPNDNAWNADWIGHVGPGAALEIRGAIADVGPDVFDGFSLRTAVPCDVEFELWADSPFADLDLCVYDPVLGEFTLCYETGAVPESGVFTLPGGYDFHLVVSAFAGASGYSLDVRVRPASSHAASAGGPPEDARGRAHLRAAYGRGAAAEAEAEEPRVRPGWLLEVDEDGALRSVPVELLPAAG